VTTATYGRITDPAATFTIVGARVVDPSTATDRVQDVAVVGGVIAETPEAGAEIVDGSGMVVAPGFCDLHTHLRQPGSSGAETIASGARAAARGGFTTVCAMPNTEPALDSPDALQVVLALGADAACRVRVVGAATRGRDGRLPSDVSALVAAGAVGVSDDGAVVDGAVAHELFALLATTGVPLIEHAEDPALAAGGVMRAGPTATRLGLRGWSPLAESEVVRRDLALAEKSGGRLHLTHLSSADAIRVVRAAKSRGVRVTCDVTPHHLALSDEWIGGSRSFAWEEDGHVDASLAYDGACRVNPPLASRLDARALAEGLADGTVDAIATDHAPHPAERKLVPFDSAAPGLIGLETALSLGLAAVDAGWLDLGVLIGALATRPAEVIGEARSLATGAPAELVLFDPAARWRVEPSALASASANTPLLGMDLPGVVRLTVAGGRVTYRS
jgi:dihydroorotase